MSKNGLVVEGDGLVCCQCARFTLEGRRTARLLLHVRGQERFPHFGINISVLEPGERIGMYHRERAQEAFLVLAGECTLIVEGQERPLATWDFFYCAPETEHIIVAAGQQSAVVLAVGARGRGVAGGLLYTVCKAAARYGASVTRETADPAVAYAKVWAKLPRSRFVKYRRGWLPRD